MSGLPIDPVLPELTRALKDKGCAVLQAPPGAGKTTMVPLHLAASGTISGRILMLEPRRIAARAAAERIAGLLGETPGAAVGYRMRGASVPGRRIEIVTEGILTRILQRHPDLPGIGCVIFDEFHERSLQADLGLALVLESRAALRPDLRLLVMSATLDAEPVATLLGDAPVITAEGRAFEVETRWLDRPRGAASGRRESLAVDTADLVLAALGETEGGVLVFLPGQAEIEQTAGRLSARLPDGVQIQKLHGGLGLEAQRVALAPLPAGRKLVLSTAIAETSLTIPDIRVVVDAGRARRPCFDPGSGMSRLVTERVTRSEAEQRRGRAGRVAPGWCYRLWSRGEEGALMSHAPPEIASADLAGFALDLAQWGADRPDALAFLSPPPEAAFSGARELLHDLGALGSEGRITDHGRRLAEIPLHPRLAHMLVVASQSGARDLAADIAALVGARDPIRGSSGPAPTDLAIRLAALRSPDRAERDHPIRVDRGAISAIRAESTRLRRQVETGKGLGAISAGAVLSLAYPDRIALRRSGTAPRYLLSGGKGAVLPEADQLAGVTLLAVADLDGDPTEARIRRALPVSLPEVRLLHADRISPVQVCAWSRRDRKVVARERLMLGALALEDRPWPDAPPEKVARALLDGVGDLGLDCLPWSDTARRRAARVEWLRARGVGTLPDMSPDGLVASLSVWLAPWLGGMSRSADFSGLDLDAALAAMLDRSSAAELERLAPVEIRAPTGTRLRIDYAGDMPAISVRLQEMFGLTSHPRLGPDRVPLVIHLLSPAGRPVQTTTDLPGFWSGSYGDVRRELRGRYPKHSWPEDPTTAAPTRRTRRHSA